MKAKVWVLSTCCPGETDPCFPNVFATEEAAEAEAEMLLKEEWQHNAPVDLEGESRPWPGNWREANAAMVEAGEATFGGWELTSHEIDVAIPQAFRDLLLLARPLMEEAGDYHMMAVLEACEALADGAEASPAPAEDLNPMEVYPWLLRRATVSLDGNTFKVALHTSDPKMRGGFDGKP